MPLYTCNVDMASFCASRPKRFRRALEELWQDEELAIPGDGKGARNHVREIVFKRYKALENINRCSSHETKHHIGVSF